MLANKNIQFVKKKTKASIHRKQGLIQNLKIKKKDLNQLEIDLFLSNKW